MAERFDPQEHIRRLDDGSEHLDLKWRLVWLRNDHPNARIETQIVPGEDDEIICRASITFPDTNSGVSAHGSARRPGDGSPIEAAEDRALARALASLGYGTEYTADDEVDTVEAPAPPVSLMTARSLIEHSTEDDDESHEPPPDPRATEPESSEPQPQTPQQHPQAQSTDYSWTKFWEWARNRGYQNANQLNQLLGIDDVTAHTPLEVRRMLKKYELENPPGDPDE